MTNASAVPDTGSTVGSGIRPASRWALAGRKFWVAVSVPCSILVAWAVWLAALSSPLTTSGVLPGYPSFVPLTSIPMTLRSAALADANSVRASTEDYREALTLKDIPERPSLAVQLGRSLLGVYGTSNVFRRLEAAELGSVISLRLSSNRIQEVFINRWNYGAPGSGEGDMAAAAEYFFHKPLADLTAQDARFLISPQPDGPPFTFAVTAVAPVFFRTPATKYNFELIPIPVQFGDAMHNGGINNFGRIAGSTQSDSYAFLRDGQHTISLPGGGRPTRMNDFGEAVGDNADKQAVLWDATGHPHLLEAAKGSDGCAACSVNNNHLIAGLCYDPSGMEACLWRNGHVHPLGSVPGCKYSILVGLNNAGQASGWVITKDNQTQAMVYENGMMHDIAKFRGGLVSEAIAINGCGQVVGDVLRSDGELEPFLWQDGVMHGLGELHGYRYAKAISINDLGQIVGVTFPRQPAPTQATGGTAFYWDIGGIRDVVPLIENDPKRPVDLTNMVSGLGINNRGQILIWNAGRTGPHQYLLLQRPRLSNSHQ